jgi:hypothetical protein
MSVLESSYPIVYGTLLDSKFHRANSPYILDVSANGQSTPFWLFEKMSFLKYNYDLRILEGRETGWDEGDWRRVFEALHGHGTPSTFVLQSGYNHTLAIMNVKEGENFQFTPRFSKQEFYEGSEVVETMSIQKRSMRMPDPDFQAWEHGSRQITEIRAKLDRIAFKVTLSQPGESIITESSPLLVESLNWPGMMMIRSKKRTASVQTT